MSHPTTAHAVSLSGHLDARVSRWLWLVKMLLAIPHFLVLVPLAVVLVMLTLAAGAAILATGRYPRRIFELTLGILRWNWRVGFYVYAALGTDRYPPFTLGAAPDYPAALDIRYPEASSRGLVLVRWLLAAPHVLIVGLVTADIMLYPVPALNTLAGDMAVAGGYSVLNLLVVIAGFFLLVTGVYPAALFGFLMGISRWCYRVFAYLAFLTDEYPPFCLDTGATEAVPA
ncbi:MAG: DUF4389 domain-containing protein [Protaetiibacter sp.]